MNIEHVPDNVIAVVITRTPSTHWVSFNFSLFNSDIKLTILSHKYSLLHEFATQLDFRVNLDHMKLVIIKSCVSQSHSC